MDQFSVIAFAAAFVVFLVAATGRPDTRVKLVPLGLAIWVAVLLVSAIRVL